MPSVKQVDGRRSNKNISKKRKFVQDGVFYQELNEFLSRVLGEDGYQGVEIRVTPIRTEIIVRQTRTREVLGEKGRRIRELTSLVQKRFGFRDGSVELFQELVRNRGCCQMQQQESLRFKLLGGLPVRRACYGVLRFVMKHGQTGCEVIVSGKLRQQRQKVMKFRDGYLISSGEPKNHYIVESQKHVMMRQGVLGVKVKIMLGYDPKGEMGTSHMMPDKITIHEPKPDVEVQTLVQNQEEAQEIDYQQEDVAQQQPEQPQQPEQHYEAYQDTKQNDW